MPRIKAKPVGMADGVSGCKIAGADLWDSPLHRATDVDEVVGDHAETNPALHAGVAFVATAVETMSAFDHADAALTAGAKMGPA